MATTMTDAFKKLFLGLGGTVKNLLKIMMLEII